MCKKRKDIEQNNPIEELMKTTLSNLKSIIDVNTIIGEPINNSFGAVILPISKVSIGLVSGGGEYNGRKKQTNLPFAGGSGAGVSVTPIGFLAIINEVPNFIKIENRTNFDKLGDLLPELLDMLEKRKKEVKDEK